MARCIFATVLFLIFQFRLQAQFMVDTLDVVDISAKKTIKKVSFSTFTSKLSLSGAHFGITTTEQDTSIKDRILPVAIRVQNTKCFKVRLDSLFVKSSTFDTSKMTITLNIYAANKLYSSAKLKLATTKGKISTLYFDTPIFLTNDTSYIGFTLVAKGNFNVPFTFYTNKKIDGYLYLYNKNLDEFKLFYDNDMPSVTCPQIQLYYSRVYEE